MACNIQTRNLGPRNILLGKDTYQEFCVTVKGDVSDSLNEKFFVVHEPITQNKHYFWFDSTGSAVDPAVPNATGHKVTIATNDQAIDVAVALAGVMNPLSWMSATAAADHVDCLMSAYGAAYELRDSTVALSQTGFTFTVVKFGNQQVDLGGTDGSIKMSLKEQNVEVKTPQTGNFVVAEIRQGATLSVSFSLQDTSALMIQKVMGFYGSTIVPDNGSGKVLSGYGSSNLFKTTDDVATQLILRPSGLAGNADASQDFTIPKAKLKLGDLDFAADKILILPVEATAYLDTSDNKYLNFFSYGDKSAL